MHASAVLPETYRRLPEYLLHSPCCIQEVQEEEEDEWIAEVCKGCQHRYHVTEHHQNRLHRYYHFFLLN